MIRSLEGLRGVAAVMVALYHLNVGAGYFPPIRHGYLFVDLFFVLSGFVIAGAYAGRLGSVWQVCAFIVRRWGRVFPLLLACTVLFVLAHNAAADAVAWPTWSEMLATLTLTHSMGVFHRLILNFASWSISVEFWTYVLFALLCIALPRRARLAASLAIAVAAEAVAVQASIAAPRDCLALGKCLDVSFDHGYARCVASFLLGSMVWEVRGAGRAVAARVQVAVLPVLAILFFLLGVFPGVAFLMPVAFAALIWALADDQGPLARVLSGRVAALLGERSYSVYLLHPVLLVLLWQGIVPGGALESVLLVASYLAALLWLAGWTYRWVEAPARARCNALAARIEARAPAMATAAIAAAGGKSE